MFQAAAGAKVFSPQTASLLIGAVALSMLLSPLLLVAIDKLLLPRFANSRGRQLDQTSGARFQQHRNRHRRRALIGPGGCRRHRGSNCHGPISLL